jgi:hypothetical protein
MDDVQAELFGEFPRRVGTPNQHWVFNEAQFDIFVDTIDGVRGAYTTLNHLPVFERLNDVSDKVLFDFDTPAKDEEEGNGKRWDHPDIEPNEPADTLAQRMRADRDLADDILGPVVEDAKKLARASADDGIPVLGVFSGFGIHVHQLYQTTEEPRVAMTSIASKYHDELNLQTMDWECVGQPEKLCRVPNVERASYREGDFGQRVDGRPTGVYTIPLERPELRDLEVSDLLEWSRNATDTACFDLDFDRPQMPVWEDYRDERAVGDGAEQPQRPVDTRTQGFGDTDMEWLLEQLIRMPCMVERLMQPNPEHKVRLNGAVMLFNVGLNPQQVETLFSELGWVDFDRKKTRKYLKQIYRRGYSDMNCESIRANRLCTRSDDPESCPCFGWSGGQPEWKA